MNYKKHSGLAIAIVLLLVSAGGYSQIPNKWVKVESSGKDVSLTMPADFLVYSESENRSDRKTIYAFASGVSMVFSAAEVYNARENLGRIRVEEEKDPSVLDFRLGEFYGKYITYLRPQFRSLIFLAKKDRSYRFEVSSRNKDGSDVMRFLRSIVAGGEHLVASAKAVDDSPSEVISLKSLKTSPTVSEVLKRKPERYTGKVSYESLAAFKDCAGDIPERPAIVFDVVRPEMSRGFLDVCKGGNIRIRLQLMANGHVGDIIIYSDVDIRVLKAYAESAKKLRFMPAKNGVDAVDSCNVERSTFGVEVSGSILVIS